MGTALQYYRDDLAKFPHQAFLVPAEARMAEFKARLAGLPGKKVGICWRSMMMGSKRAKYFSPIDSWGPILQTPGISFVNIQMGTALPTLRAPRRPSASRSIRWKAWT